MAEAAAWELAAEEGLQLVCSQSRDGDWPNVATISECQPWSAPTDSKRLVMPLNYICNGRK
jgi:hypothetical protein